MDFCCSARCPVQGASSHYRIIGRLEPHHKDPLVGTSLTIRLTLAPEAVNALRRDAMAKLVFKIS